MPDSNRSASRSADRAERVPPHSLEAEEAVLGAMILSPPALTWAMANLRRDMFYRPAHGRLFEVMAEMTVAGKPVDTALVAAELTRLGELEDLGGAPFIFTLTETCPIPEQAAHYGQVVRDLARVRRLIDTGASLVEIGFQPAADPDKVSSDLVHALLDELRPPDGSAFAGAGVMAELERATREEYDSDRWASTGLEPLDRWIQGLAPGRLITIAAEPGGGKSSLLLQIAAHVARTVDTLVWSYEMSAAEIAAHAMASEAGLPLVKALSGKDLRLGEWDKAHATVADLKWSVMVDSPAVNALFARTVAAHARRPLGLVVVDYLQLMDASDARRDDNRAYELGEITRALKKLAQRLKVPVLVASQLTRPKGDRRPGLRDMADSSSIEKNSDQVIIIHDRSTLEVAKSRMGPLGEFPVEWVGERAMFRAPLFERKAALAAVPPI